MSDIYYQKYLKYKSKYINKLNQINQYGGTNKKYNYYFVHGVKDIEILKTILEDKYLRPGKDVPPKMRYLGGEESELDDIYMNIYFEDIKNLSFTLGLSLILHPKILWEYGLEFQGGWGGYGKIKINKNDSTNIIKKKIREIKKFLKNPDVLPQKIREFSQLHHHQILFDRPIPLKGNLLGIVCNQCSDEIIDDIKCSMKDNIYKNIVMYTQNSPMPQIKDLHL